MFQIFQDNAPPSLSDDLRLVRTTRAAHLDRYKSARARAFEFLDRHALILGGTRRGKSGLLGLTTRALIARGIEGASLIDPHGSFARDIIEWLAHPASGLHERIVHIIDPSSAYSIGLNPLRPYDDTWEACHDAATALASVIESRFEASPEQTPLLARIVYVGSMLCARHGLTLLELVELLSLGGDELRRSLLQDFDNRVVRRELEDLCLLADKSPREFLNLVQSAKNRFVRWLGDRRLARILGQKRGLDLRAVMDNREIVIADLSALNYSDAALVGAIYTSMAFAAARRRPRSSALATASFSTKPKVSSRSTLRACATRAPRWASTSLRPFNGSGSCAPAMTLLPMRCSPTAPSRFASAVWNPKAPATSPRTCSLAMSIFANGRLAPNAQLPPGKRQLFSRIEHVPNPTRTVRCRARPHMESSARASAAMSASMFSAGASFGSGASSSFAVHARPCS